MRRLALAVLLFALLAAVPAGAEPLLRTPALSRTQKLTGRAKPLQPHFVFRTKLLLEFLAKSLCQRGTFSVRRNRNLQIAALHN